MSGFYDIRLAASSHYMLLRQNNIGHITLLAIYIFTFLQVVLEIKI
jgi:hypothetical protein